MENEIPNEIHKYFPYERAIEFLQTRKIRYESPKNFNDPFEFFPKLYEKKYLQSMKSGNYEALIKRDIEDAGFTENEISLLTGLSIVAFPFGTLFGLAAMNSNKKKKLKKIQHDLEILNHYRQMNNLFKVSCFSEDDKNILMWAHYTHNHTGLLISFNTAEDYWGNDLRKVEYQPNRVDVPLEFSLSKGDPIVSQKWQRALLIMKAECWKYEQEWRCIKQSSICKEDRKGHYHEIDKNAVQKIVLGWNMPNHARKEVVDVVRNEWREIPIYEIVPNENNYTLDMIPFEDGTAS